MLHIGLRSVGARERSVQLDDAVRSKRLQLIGVEKILIGVAAAEEQHRRAELRPLRLAMRALLQEAAERRQPGAGADHDHGHGGIVGKTEAGLGLAHGGMHAVADATAGEIVRTHALVDAASRTGGRFHDADRDAAARRIDRGR